eukprot:4856989-Prymnesium_polylepis.1
MLSRGRQRFRLPQLRHLSWARNEPELAHVRPQRRLQPVDELASGRDRDDLVRAKQAAIAELNHHDER